jgi:hypothetical protein
MSTEAMRKALEHICGARLCSVNSMSSRREADRLLDEAVEVLREAVTQATIRERDRRVYCPECDSTEHVYACERCGALWNP